MCLPYPLVVWSFLFWQPKGIPGFAKNIKAYLEANPNQSAMHPDEFQFTIPNPVYVFCMHILKQSNILIPDEIQLHELIDNVLNLMKMVQEPDKIGINIRIFEF